MIVVEEGINNIQLTLAFLNQNNDYTLRIEDAFKQYVFNLAVEDVSPNKNFYSQFEVEVVTDINDQDIPNNVIFLTKNKRYLYFLYDLDGKLVDNGYLIFVD